MKTIVTDLVALGSVAGGAAVGGAATLAGLALLNAGPLQTSACADDGGRVASTVAIVTTGSADFEGRSGRVVVSGGDHKVIIHRNDKSEATPTVLTVSRADSRCSEETVVEERVVGEVSLRPIGVRYDFVKADELVPVEAKLIEANKVLTTELEALKIRLHESVEELEEAAELEREVEAEAKRSSVRVLGSGSR